MKHRLKIAGALIFGLIICPICSIQWLLTGKNLGFKWLMFVNDEFDESIKKHKE